jgi:hypothetical protein
MQDGKMMELLYVIFMFLNVLWALIFMIVDVIILLQHFSYNLTMARDFILKSLSFIICKL